MKCYHEKTKIKLLAWAIKSRYGHEQGFKYVMCCALCGSKVNALEGE